MWQNIKQWWAGYSERHPELSKFLMFFIVSNGVTLLQIIVMPLFRNIFAGTALIGAELVSRSDPAVDRGGVLAAATDIAADDAASEASRVTALRVAALMGDAGIVAAARMLAQVGETETLRLAAVATLGDVGDAGDAELLRAVAASSDKRLGPAARGALKRLNARLGRPAGRGEEGA